MIFEPGVCLSIKHLLRRTLVRLLILFSKVPKLRCRVQDSIEKKGIRIDDPRLNETSWRTDVGTSRKFTFTGLEAGKKYFVRIIAIGAKDQKAISNVASRLVQ